MAMVFQSYALYPHKTVPANIEFPLKARGVGKAGAGCDGARRPPALLGLGELLQRKPGAARPVANASASRSPGRSCAAPPCSAWTSR